MVQVASRHLRRQAIQGLRKSLGWSAQRLADVCAELGERSLTRSTIAKIESGVRRSVNARELAVLAEALGVAVDDLLESSQEVGLNQYTQARSVVVAHVGSQSPMSAEWPVRIGVVPRLASDFQERDLCRVLAEAADEDVAPVWVLSGLGGTGKTQLAANYANAQWVSGKLDLLVWVGARNRESVLASYSSVFRRIVDKSNSDPESDAQGVLEWLSETNHRWLVVLDGLTNPADLHGLWPPDSAVGQVVVTTRRREAALAGRGRLFNVDSFSPQEAVRFLHARLASWPALLEGADALASELGFLPLALSQVVSYLYDRGLTCADYLERLIDSRRKLRDLVPGPDSLPDDHESTLDSTLSLAVETANHLEPQGMAKPLLQVASLLDANGIPAQLFSSSAVSGWVGSVVGKQVCAEDIRDSLYCLHRLSLIDFDSDSPVMRVHVLVQRVTREGIPEGLFSSLARVVSDALHQEWPEYGIDVAAARIYQANAATFHDAVSAFEKLLADQSQVLGPTSRNAASGREESSQPGLPTKDQQGEEKKARPSRAALGEEKVSEDDLGEPEESGWPAPSLLARLRPTTREALLSLGSDRLFEAGQNILRQGDGSTHVVLLLNGSARVQALSGDGEDALLNICIRGDLVGDTAALEQRSQPASVTASVRTSTRLINSADFRRFLYEHADAAIEMVIMVNSRLLWANRRRIDLANLPPTQRVWRVLLEVADSCGERDPDGNWHVGQGLEHEELATLAGVRLRTVEKELRKLEELGVVRRSYRNIIITDPARLRLGADYHNERA